jgi:ABC-type phosphate transport system auxiliary subunit
VAPPLAIDFGILCSELDALIEGPPATDADTRARVERTLTDGYAGALSLEAERLRLERRIGEVASQVRDGNKERKADELADLSSRLNRASGELMQLRKLLVAARSRGSAAA